MSTHSSIDCTTISATTTETGEPLLFRVFVGSVYLDIPTPNKQLVNRSHHLPAPYKRLINNTNKQSTKNSTLHTNSQ